MNWEKPKVKERTIEDDFGAMCIFALVKAKTEILERANQKGEYVKDYSIIDDKTKTEILKAAVYTVFMRG